jgi:hypothetical protein
MTFKSFVRHIENKPQEIPKVTPEKEKKRTAFEISVAEYVRNITRSPLIEPRYVVDAGATVDYNPFWRNTTTGV